MTVDLFPNIPRVYTALAESIACLIFILPLAKRKNWFIIFPLMSAGQFILQLIVGTWPLLFWIPGMILNVLWMFLSIWLTCQINLKQTAYISAKAFIIAEFVASFAWQTYCHLLWVNNPEPSYTPLFVLPAYLVLFLIFYFVERKLGSTQVLKTIQKKNVFIAGLTAVIIFAISNVGFMMSTSSVLMSDTITIFLMRTLINLCGICILYMQEIQHSETHLKKELTAINNMFQGQYDQYKAYKESNSIINRKFHDLKHQIEIIRGEENTEKREEYLNNMSQAITSFSANIETGNGILNTILTQKNQVFIENNIAFTCIVDGQLLDSLDTLDICSLFGNALDNSLESVMKIPNIEQRLINLRVFQKGNFIMISFENYTTDELEFDEGLPVTTKADKNYHGYGIKSISYIVDKYKGNMTINLADNWFSLKILLPA